MALTTVNSAGIKDGEIVNADVNASAAIAGSKISPDFGSQNITTTGNIDCASDANKLRLGASQDLEIYHDGTDGFIQHSTGKLRLNGDTIYLKDKDNGDMFIQCNHDAGVQLRYDNSAKLETTSSGVTVTGTISDSKGNVRSIPANTQGGAYVGVAADAGKVIYISTGGVTINNSVYSAGDAVSIINASGSNQTITQGSSFNLYNTGDGTTGNRTLAGRGMCTIWFVSDSVAYISGSGLT